MKDCNTCEKYPNCFGCGTYIYMLVKALENEEFNEHHSDKVVHAKWETIHTINSDCIVEKICYCSNCKKRAIIKNNEYMLTEYCPNCGAKMRDNE